MRELLLLRAPFEQTLRFDLEEFKLDEGVIRGQATKADQNLFGFFLPVVMDEPTRRERHENHTDTEDQRRRKLQCQREQPCCLALGRASASDVVGAVVDPKWRNEFEKTAMEDGRSEPTRMK